MRAASTSPLSTDASGGFSRSSSAQRGRHRGRGVRPASRRACYRRPRAHPYVARLSFAATNFIASNPPSLHLRAREPCDQRGWADAMGTSLVYERGGHALSQADALRRYRPGSWRPGGAHPPAAKRRQGRRLELASSSMATPGTAQLVGDRSGAAQPVATGERRVE